MSLSDHIRQELTRINELTRSKEEQKQQLAMARLRDFCDTIELQIKAALAQNKLECFVPISKEFAASTIVDGLSHHKGLPRKAMTLQTTLDCICGSPCVYGCTCTNEQLIPRVSGIVISFKALQS